MNKLVLSAEDVYQFNQGSEQAFKKVFDIYYKKLTYYIQTIVDEHAEAEDIAVSTLYKAWQKRQSFDVAPLIESFLYTVARNAAFNYLKSDKRAFNNKKAYADYIENDSDEIQLLEMQTDFIAIIRDEIENLPTTCKQVFKMRHIDKLSYDEIAERLSIKPNTAASHNRHAVTLLREMLAKRDDMHLTAFIFFLLFR